MKTLDKAEFTERHGDPASFFFKGQCYDAGPHSKTKCSLCGKRIRLVYILRNSSDRSVPSGDCCFRFFQKWNPDLFDRLLAAQLNLETVEQGIDRDFKHYRAKAELSLRQREWRQVRREARKRIREFKKVNGDWLPADLFKLQEEVDKEPGKTSRWYENHTVLLQEALKKAA